MPIGTPADPSLLLDDGVASYAPGSGAHTGYGKVGGVARVFDSGAGFDRWDGVAVFNITAIDTASGDEGYTLSVQGSNTADFSGAVQTLANISPAVPGQQVVALYSVVNETNYRYFRLAKALTGTTPSVKVQAFVLPLAGVDDLSMAELVKLLGLQVDNMFGATSNFRAWAAGEADGGPDGDGKYPLSDGAGGTWLVPCPAAIAAMAGSSGSRYPTLTAALAAAIPSSVTTVTVDGYAAAGDGGAALWRRAPVQAAGNGKRLGHGGVYWELGELVVRPRMLGAKGDGATNDAAAVLEAHTWAESQSRGLDFESGTYLVGAQQFLVDLTKSHWFSSGRGVVKWTGAPAAGAALIVYATGGYNARHHASRPALDGLSFQGGGQTTQHAGTLLQVGRGVGTYATGCPLISHCSFEGFTNAINFVDGGYFAKFDHCHIRWGTITTPGPSRPTDFGEIMVFDHCFISESLGVYLSWGEWKLTNTSLDNACLYVSNDAVVDMNGGHLENPGNPSTTPRYIEMTDEATVNLRGVLIVLNPPGGGLSQTRPVFLVDVDDGIACGLTFDQCTWVQMGTYDPRLGGYPQRTLCEGAGRTAARGCKILAWKNFNYISVGYGAQLLARGDFEGGSVTGWIREDSGGGVGATSFAADSSEAHSGAYSGKISATWTSGSSFGSEVYQRFAVKPGDIVLGGLWFKNDIAPITSGALFNVNIRFKDGKGNDLGAGVFSHITDAHDWTFFQIGNIVPPGAAFVDLAVIVLANSAQTLMEAWIDDCLLNIIPAA